MSTEYVAVLDALKETLNNSNNLTSFASEFVKHYSLYKVVNEKEQNKEFTETVYERNFLREILLLLLERLGRDAREKDIDIDAILHSKELMIAILSVMKASLRTSEYTNKLKTENVNARLLLKDVAELLSVDASKEEKEKVRKNLFDFQEQCIKFDELGKEIGEFFIRIITDVSQELDLTKHLQKGWDKNRHELKKRSKKLQLFSISSKDTVSKIEEEIQQSQLENKEFRKVLDKTSEQLEHLVEQMKNTSKDSDIIVRQLEVIETTMNELEKCKQNTENTEVEQKFIEKQNMFMEYLKFIDQDLQDKIVKHQAFVYNNKNFDLALEEIVSCFENFETEERRILQKYNIAKPSSDLDKEKIEFFGKVKINNTQSPKPVSQKYLETSEGRWKLIEKLQEDKVNLHKEKLVLEDQVESLTNDLDDIYSVNEKLCEELNAVKASSFQIHDCNSSRNCFVPSSKDGSTVCYPIIHEVEENDENGKEDPQDHPANSESKEQVNMEISDLKVEIISLNETLKRYEAENQKLRKSLEDLQQTQRDYEDTPTNQAYDKGNTMQQKISELNIEIEDLQLRNEQLLKINKKAQAIYEENKELLDENTALQEEINSLEEELNKSKRNIVNPSPERDEQNTVLESQKKKISDLEKSLQEADDRFKTKYQPRIIYLKTGNIDAVKVDFKTKELQDDSENNMHSIEQALIDERDRTLTLENSNKLLKSSYDKILAICKKIGLDTLQIGIQYDLQLKSCDGSQILSSNGIIFTEKEKKAFSFRNAQEYETNEIVESVIEELSNMLQLSYRENEKLKDCKKLIEKELKRLNNELKSKETQTIDERNINLQEGDLVDVSSRELALLKTTLADMGVGRLDYGVMYSVHFQAMDKNATSRKVSRVYQHSCKPLCFDEVKKFIQSSRSSSLTRSLERNRISPKVIENARIQFSFEALIEELEIDYNKRKISQDHDTKSKVHLERLLRISSREKEELKKKNKVLQSKLKHLQESKEEFQNVKNSELDFKLGDTGTYEITDSELKLELEDAYNLSEANCIFLENRYREVEKNLLNAELQIDQVRQIKIDLHEQVDCLNKEVFDWRQKFKENEKVVTDLKREIDFLERDVEYYKQVLLNHGIEINEEVLRAMTLHKPEASPGQDVIRLEEEKQRLLSINENLSRKLEFIEAEKVFANQQIKELQLSLSSKKTQISEEQDKKQDAKINNPNSITNQKEKANETGIQQVGLAKKYKKLQREYKNLRKEFENKILENSDLLQKYNLMKVDIDCLKSKNEELTEKIVNLDVKHEKIIVGEKTVKENKDLAAKVIRHWSRLTEKQNKQLPHKLLFENDYDEIKKETMLLAHENEEIKESNNVLMLRNFELKKESLLANTNEKQIQILRRKLSTLENENAILKLENLKSSKHRRKSFIANVQTSLLTNTVIRKDNIGTQTEEARCVDVKENDDHLYFTAEVEELRFINEDLTTRNTELKTKLFDMEKVVNKIDYERETFEHINEKLLAKNQELKSQLKDENRLRDLSEDTDNQTLGLSFSFKNNILNDYEKLELEEQNKTLMYENKMLKEQSQEKENASEILRKQIQNQQEKIQNLEKTKDELFMILNELKGEQFVDILLENLKLDRSSKSKSHNSELRISHSRSSSGTLENISSSNSFNCLYSLPQATSECNELTDLKIQNTNLEKENKRLQTTVEHLERQLLQTSHYIFDENKNTEFSKENYEIESTDSKLSDDAKRTTPESYSENQNATVEELFEIKFLLESTNNNITSGNNTANYNITSTVNNFESKSLDGFVEYTNCIKEGELSSEMEDLFKRYSEESKLNNEEINANSQEIKSGRKRLFEPSAVPDLPKEILRKSSIKRFRSKEYLEAALEETEKSFQETKDKNEKLKTTITEIEQKLLLKSNENEILKKEVEILHTNVTECVLLIDAEKSSKENLSKHNTSLVEELTELKSLNESLGKEINEYEKKINEYEIIITDQVRVIKEFELNKANYETKLSQLSTELTETNQIKNEIEDDISLFREADKNEFTRKSLMLEEKLAERDETIKQLNEKLALESEVGFELKDLVFKKEGVINSNDNKILGLENAIASKDDAILKMKKDIEILSNENYELSKKQELMEGSDGDLLDMINEYEQKDENILNLKSELSKQKSMCNSTEKELVETNEANEVLIKELEKLKLCLAEKENLIHKLRERSQSIIPFEICKPEYPFPEKESTPVKFAPGDEELQGLPRILEKKENVYVMYESKRDDSLFMLKEEKDDGVANKLDNKLDNTRDEGKPALPDIFITATENQEQNISFKHLLSEECISERRNGKRDLDFSDISEDENFTEQFDYSVEYIHKLKTKINNLQERLREKKRTIRSQNEDIDTFLEDIRCKDILIEKLKIEVNAIDEKLEKGCQTNEGVLELKTPSFSHASTLSVVDTTDLPRQLILESRDENNDELEMFTESLYKELRELKRHVENLKSVSLHDIEKHELHVIEACDITDNLELNFRKYIDNFENEFNVITSEKNIVAEYGEENIDLDDSYESLAQKIQLTPVLLKSPGKTVKQIRKENQFLVKLNNELKLKNSDLENDINQYCALHEEKTNEILVLKKQLEQCQENIEKILDEKNEEMFKAVDEKEKEIRLLYFQCKDNEFSNFRKTRQKHDEYMHEDPALLIKKLEELNDKLRTSEAQIEKDWIIIEGQGEQLENLHQQFIEQRDENRKHSKLLEAADKELYYKEQRIDELERELNEKTGQLLQGNTELIEIKTISKTKEEELESLLQEKEEGIEKLHEMISELEKSLNNSQKHIEGILNESMDHREREKEKMEIINEQEITILELKEEVTVLKGKIMETREDDTDTASSIGKKAISGTLENVNSLKDALKLLKSDFEVFSGEFQAEFYDIPRKVKEIYTNEKNLASKIRDELLEQVKSLEIELERRDNVNRLKINMLIKSLAGRSNIVPRKNGKVLTPTLDLGKASARMGPTEFLQTCVQHLKDKNYEDVTTNSKD